MPNVKMIHGINPIVHFGTLEEDSASMKAVVSFFHCDPDPRAGRPRAECRYWKVGECKLGSKCEFSHAGPGSGTEPALCQVSFSMVNGETLVANDLVTGLDASRNIHNQLGLPHWLKVQVLRGDRALKPQELLVDHEELAIVTQPVSAELWRHVLPWDVCNLPPKNLPILEIYGRGDQHMLKFMRNSSCNTWPLMNPEDVPKFLREQLVAELDLYAEVSYKTDADGWPVLPPDIERYTISTKSRASTYHLERPDPTIHRSWWEFMFPLVATMMRLALASPKKTPKWSTSHDFVERLMAIDAA